MPGRFFMPPMVNNHGPVFLREGPSAMEIRFVRWPQVIQQTGLPQSSLCDLIAAELFPAPVAIGKRTVGFASHEIEGINAARLAGKGDDEIRDLVRWLADQRPRFWDQLELELHDDLEQNAPQAA